MLKKWLPGLIGLSALALVGRLAGFLREVLMASKFGASSITDAYLTTLILFDLAIAANNSIISGTLSYLSGRNESDKSFTKYLQRLSWFALGTIIMVGFLLFPLINWVIPLFFSSIIYETKIILDSTKILLILFSFVISCGILSAALQLKGKLSIPGGLSIFLNGFSILSLIFLSNNFGIISIPIGLLTGAVLFFLFQYFHTNRSTLPVQTPAKISIIPWLISTVLVFGNLILPNIIALFERYFALGMNAGTFSHYTYAGKFALLPLTIFAYAVSTSLLPIQTKYLQENNHSEFERITSYGILITLVSAGLLAMLFFVFADPIVKIIYEHGRFNFNDTNSTATTLQIFSFGLYPLLITPIIANIFYSLRITKQLVLIGIFSMLMNAMLLILWVRIIPDSRALAISSIISAWINLIVSIIVLSRNGKKIPHNIFGMLGLFFIGLTVSYSIVGNIVWKYLFPLHKINQLKPLEMVWPTVIGSFILSLFYLLIIWLLIRKYFPELTAGLKEIRRWIRR